MKNELYHFKYLRKYKSTSGEWRYVYDDRKIQMVGKSRSSEQWAQAKKKGAEFLAQFLKSTGRALELFITSGNNYGKNRR